MDKFIIFITIIAWVVGMGSTLFIIARFIAIASYTDLDRTLDTLHGRVVTFPIVRPILLATVCWSWVIAQYIG